jgi:hypothetical protein
MEQEISQENIDIINNIFKKNNPKNYIVFLHGDKIGGDVKLNLNLNDIAKSKNIDLKKMNFIIAYLGETMDISGNFEIINQQNPTPIPKYPTPITECPTPITECPICISQCNDSYVIYHIIILILVVIIVIIFIIMIIK